MEMEINAALWTYVAWEVEKEFYFTKTDINCKQWLSAKLEVGNATFRFGP